MLDMLVTSSVGKLDKVAWCREPHRDAQPDSAEKSGTEKVKVEVAYSAMCSIVTHSEDDPRKGSCSAKSVLLRHHPESRFRKLIT